MNVFGLAPGQRIMVAATHLDDESLGLGGTIARAVEEGIDVDVLVVAAATDQRSWGAGNQAQDRLCEFAAACDVLGVSRRSVLWTDVPQARNPGAYMAEMTAAIESGPVVSLQASRCTALLIPASGAFHQDHRAVHRAAFAAARPAGDARHTPPLVLGYRAAEDQTWRAEPGAPAPLLVDITATAKTKAKALECYATQLRDASHPRSLDQIALLDAAAAVGSGAGSVEAFTVYRWWC